jgi:single-strand DNA-binding protein
MRSFIMAHVRVEQRNAHLAGPVHLAYVTGRDGPVAKAVLTAISNTRRGTGDARQEQATAIQWTLWGAQAENAVSYLDKGSHVNVVGQVQNNRYEQDGQTVYGMDFTAEEIDYLDSKGDAQARQARRGQGGGDGHGKPPSGSNAARPQEARSAEAAQS